MLGTFALRGRVTRAPGRRYGGRMSGHRGVLAAVVLLLVAAVPACGFADDNYDNAQRALDRSTPDLTVPETVTTLKPYQTIPGDVTSESIPVELATPEQRAAALVEAQQRIDDRKAGRTPGAGATRPGSGGTAPGLPATTTTTTVPDTPACRASRSVQETGVLLVTATNASPADYRASVFAVGSSFRALVPLLPPEQRNVATVVAAAFAPVESRALAATSTSAMKAEVRTFLAAQSRNVTTVLKAAAVLCPQAITDNLDQAEKVTIDG